MDKLYVPNPQRWVTFFDKVADGKAHFRQSGGARKMEILPIDKYMPGDKKIAPMNAVAPAEQTVLQAASELKREHINPKEVADMLQNPINQPRKRSSKKIVKIPKNKQSGGTKSKQTGGRKKQTGGSKASAKSKQIGGKRNQKGGKKKQLGAKERKSDIFDKYVSLQSGKFS